MIRKNSFHNNFHNSTDNASGGNKINKTLNRTKLASAIALAACWNAGAISPVSAANGELDGLKKFQIEEIIVTAEKRAQDVQDIPVAISAFSAEMMEMRGIATPQDLQNTVPSLDIAEQGSEGVAKVYLRGVGNENPNPGGDPGVPIHINGHYTQSTAYLFRDMLDVDRVEVQRGPQGTLYGRNAMGGNINIITKRPTKVFEGMLNTTIENYDKLNLQAVVSGPFAENLRGRLAIVDDRRNGYVENINLNDDEDRDSSDYTSVRGSVEYDLTDTALVYLNAYYFDDKGNNAIRVLSGDPNNPTVQDPFKINANTHSEQSDKSKGVSLDVTWEIGNLEVRSLTAYDDTTKFVINDWDGGGKPEIPNEEVIYETTYELFTQEFQLLSKSEGPLQWVTGLFYYDEEAFMNFFYKKDLAPSDPRMIIFAPLSNGAKSWAAYGQLDYRLSDKIEMVAGLRYTHDEKDRLEQGFSGSEGSPLPTEPYAFLKEDEQWSKVTGKLGLNHYFSDSSMAYISWSRGYKAGGFNFSNSGPYDPEFIDAYELGVKGQWLENRLQSNLAAFYYDYQDKQDLQRLPAPKGFVYVGIRNAAAAIIQGIELETQAYLTDALYIDLSVGYLKAQYDEYFTADITEPELGVQDLSDNTLPFSPEWTVHVGAQYTWQLSADMGGLTARVDYSWKDKRFVNGFNREGVIGVDNNDLLDPYHISNVKLRWEGSEETWSAVLFIENLTDEIIQTHKNPGPQGSATYLPPRTYGLKVQYNL